MAGKNNSRTGVEKEDIKKSSGNLREANNIQKVEASNGKKLSEEAMLKKELALLRDLEKLLELSPNDAKELIDELEQNDYGKYLEKILNTPEFAQLRDKPKTGSQNPGENLENEQSILLEKDKEATAIPIGITPLQKELEEKLSSSDGYDDITWESLLQKGLDYLTAGLPENSLYYFEKAISLERNSYKLWVNKGKALFWMNRSKEALDCINYSLELNPRNYRAWSEKGLILKSLGQYKRAMKCYSNAIKYNPTFPNGWYEKAQISQAMGNYELALRYYNKSLELDPDNKGALHFRGLCQKVLDRSKMFMME